MSTRPDAERWTDEMAKQAQDHGPASAVDGGAHQSIARLDLLMSVLASSKGEGLKLMDVCRLSGLGKATVHRLLTGLVQYRLADHDDATGRYFIGYKVLTWAAGAGERYGLARLARPGLERIAARFEDAVYLMVRHGDEAVCLDRVEGTFPIRTLAFKVGDHRPLGVGAGNTALLAFLPDEEVARILREGAAARAPHGIADTELKTIIAAARRTGYTFVDGKVIPGIATLGVPVPGADGRPVAAISVSAISDRMGEARRAEIATAVAAEAAALAQELGPLLASGARPPAAGR